MDATPPEIEPGAPTRRSTAQQIWDACVDLTNAERMITRKALSDLTELKMTLIDDHVERLVANGRLRRLGYGVLEVVEQFPPPRAMSKTVLPSGAVKFEIGDVCLDLTPKEARTAADLFRADLLMLQDISSANCALIRAAEMAQQITELRRLVVALHGDGSRPA